MNIFVCVVTDFLQEATKTVLDCASGDGMTMGFEGGQVEHLLPRVELRNFDAFGKDLVQLQKRTLEGIDHPLYLREGNKGNAVAFEYWEPAIIQRPFMRIRDHSFILNWIQLLLWKPGFQESLKYSLHLPGLARASREILGPGEVKLDDRVPIVAQRCLILRQVH